MEEENGEEKKHRNCTAGRCKRSSVQMGEGILKIDTLQMEGKNLEWMLSILRGYAVEEGMMLPCWYIALKINAP